MKALTLNKNKVLIGLAFLVVSNVLISNPTRLNLFGEISKSQLNTTDKFKKKDYDENEIVIKYKKFVAAEDMAAKTVGLGLRLNQVSARPHFTTAYINQNETVEQAIDRVKRDPSVEYAEPKYKYYKSAAAPNDTDFGKLWGLNNSGQTVSSPSYATNNPGTSGKDMDVLGAWDVTSNCSSITVAVLDTGINYNHEDLAGNMWDGSTGCVNQNGTAIVGHCPNHGWDFSSADNDPKDEDGHGSHVAGTIGAVGNNNKGISGVCQSAKLMAVRVLGINGGDNTTVSNGIYFAVRNGAKVINMSLGGTSFSSLIHDAIEFARTNDVLVVVAAGNEDTNLNTGSAYPCENTSANIVCIAALDQSYARATFSNYDNNSTVNNRTVDFGAPGTNVYSLFGTEVNYDENATGYAGWTFSGTGTSWASSTCTTGNFAMLTNPDCTLPNALFDSSAVTITTPALNTNTYVYKNFTIPNGSTKVTLSQFIVSVGERQNSSTCYDYIRINYNNTSTLTSAGGTNLPMWDSNFGAFRSQLCRNGSTSFFSDSDDVKTLSVCMNSGTNCSVGYQLVSDVSDRFAGGLVSDFYLTAWAPSNNSYGNYNGTSMASPNAAGVAALIRAYNPSFTYAEVLQKLIDGGQAESSLTGITRYGKAINANDSIKHLKQVTGVSVSLQ